MVHKDSAELICLWCYLGVELKKTIMLAEQNSRVTIWCQIWCFQKGGRHLFTKSFMHFLHFIIAPEMKPMLHFLLVCGVDLYRSSLDLITVPAGRVPDYRWASESHLAHGMASLFSGLATVFMTKVNVCPEAAATRHSLTQRAPPSPPFTCCGSFCRPVHVLLRTRSSKPGDSCHSCPRLPWHKNYTLPHEFNT